jgi:tetratricopeptide (TPR) repeat protein
MIKNYILKTSLLFFIIFSFSAVSFSQEKKLSMGQKIKIKKKLNQGKIMIYGGDYRNALFLVREVLSIDNSNATANFRASQCHLNLGKPGLGKKYAEKALKLDSNVNDEVFFVLGESYHRLGNLSEAKKFYTIFQSKSSKSTNEDYETENRLMQCDFAKKMMENPVKVSVENMGNEINTFNPEYSASISGDGKVLVFTSRRVDSEGGDVDEMSDQLYFEDIYISIWNDTTEEWSDSKPIQGNVNTETHDAVLSISSDGKSLYVYRNELGETKSGDIYVARKGKENKFGSAKPVDEGRNVNSSYFESSASVTEDGNTIYFVSDRKGSKGMADIYMSRKEGEKWGKAINLGDSINTSSDEKCVFIHPNGKLLFFTSEGHNSMGSYDIFISKKVNGRWSKAQNLGYPINSVKEEKTISVTRDGKTAYVSASYKDSKGGSDIYKIDLTNLNLLAK